MRANFIPGAFLMPHPPVIVPGVGKGQEKQAAKTVAAMRSIGEEIARLKPDTVVILSPHAPMFSDHVFIYGEKILSGDLQKFGSSETLAFEQDEALITALEEVLDQQGIPGGRLDARSMKAHGLSGSMDHGVFVPLCYASGVYSSFQTVALAPSAMDMQRVYQLGTCIRLAAEKAGRRAVIIASGDMSHKVNAQSPYGACEEGPVFDNAVIDALNGSDIPALLAIDAHIREAAAECGLRPLIALCGAFDGIKPDISVLSYEAPFGIGYCTARFTSGDDAPSALRPKQKQESAPVSLARKTLREYLRTGKAPVFDVRDELGEFQKRAGVFVSLKKFGELRGCIGTTSPTTASVAREIAQNAVSAGLHDPRFPPIREDELDFLDISVDVLGEAEPAVKDDLDPKAYGVIVSKGASRGLLLPDLDGVNTVDEQLSIACRKAGIDPRSDYDIARFTVVRYY